MRIYVIACEVFFRELSYLAALSPHVVDFRWLSQGLHDQGCEKMQARLRAELESAPAGEYDAVALAYGLCNNGTLTLTSKSCPLVIPRTHDCIALFLGSRKKYRQYFDSHPGTYFLSKGWIERDEVNLEQLGPSILDSLGGGMSYEDYAEKYGPDEADFIMEQLGDLTKNYSRLCYIRAPFEEDDSGESHACEMAAEKGWEFDRIPGDLELLRKLLWAEWDDDFLVLEPGQGSRASYDDEIFS